MGKFRLLFLITVICIATSVYAQPAIGLRTSLVDGWGITYKTFKRDYHAVEVMLNGTKNSITIVGLWEKNIILPDDAWMIIIGGGGHFGTWDHVNDKGFSYNSGVFGLDAIFGIEYFLPTTPFGISLDYKPGVNFINDLEYYPNNKFGFTIRYYLPGPHARK